MRREGGPAGSAPDAPAGPTLEVTVEAPASSANLGPGFDSLGLALELRLRVRMRLRALPPQAGEGSGWPPVLARLAVAGEGAGQLPKGPENRIWQAALRAFQAMDGARASRWAAQRLGVEGAGGWAVEVEAASAIPPASGMGSSAAAAVSGLWGANALFGSPLPYDRLLDLASEMEGHPDNAAACALGGWTVAARRAGRTLAVRLAAPRGEVAAVVGLPPVELYTEQARRALPQEVRLEEAVFNLSGAALVAACVTMGRWELLREAMEDRLHQPARLPLVPGAAAAMDRAMAAGAYGACLSGAGPSVLALAPPWQAAEVASAIQLGFGEHGLDCRTWVLEPAEEGVRVRMGVESLPGEQAGVQV